MKPLPPETRHPLSDELYAVRMLCGETQENFAKHFNVGRTSYMTWERYGPPTKYAGVQEWIKLELARLKRLATKRKHAKERRESTCRS